MTESSTLTVSVVIATKNRAEELRTISLPSLSRQDTRDFEVVVWDASEGDSSRRVVEEFSTAHPDLVVRYFKAPRPGLPAQRNDAVKEAGGDVVFFIDDDSEVSCDGIGALAGMFAEHEGLMGGGIPLEYLLPNNPYQLGRPHGMLADLARSLYPRVFFASHKATGAFASLGLMQPGEIVDSLSGCDMAFRKMFLLANSFEERLQRFSGYALWEDRMFCEMLTRKGHALLIAPRGMVVHRSAPGVRVARSWRMGLVEGYNTGILWKAAVFPHARWSVFPFIWARIGFLCVVLLPCLRWPWQIGRWKRLAGYLAGLGVFFWEEIVKHTAKDMVHHLFSRLGVHILIAKQDH